MKNKSYLLILFLAGKSFGQPLELLNPSFEADKAQCCKTPFQWYNCGPQEETPPDIQPGSFGVEMPAADGQHYLCMVVRDNNTWESIGQELAEPLKTDHYYELTVSVARAAKLISKSRLTGEEVNLVTPAVLRIWGGNDYCEKEQLLAETKIINNTEWQQVKLTLHPTTDLIHITLEAYYKTPVQTTYNGNILIDNLSLTQIP